MDKFDIIIAKIETMDQKITTMDERITSMDERITSMDEKINALDTDVKDIKLTLENEIRPNIMRVAEGHLDLSRKLDQAIKSNNEFEMLSIRVGMLETDVRDIKRKIS